MNLAEAWNRSRTPEHEPVVLEEERPEPIDGESEWDFRHRCLAWLGFGNYESYLESKLWKSIRYRVMRNSGGICTYCKKPVQVVHHRRYTARGLQGTSDKWLVALCHECHEKQHRGWKRIEDSELEIQVRRQPQRFTTRKRGKIKIRQFRCAKCNNMLKLGIGPGGLCRRCRPAPVKEPIKPKKIASGEHHF